MEFERFGSIARLVASPATEPEGSGSSRSPWYAAWIHESLEAAGMHGDGTNAA